MSVAQRPRSRRQERKEETRTELIAAAGRVFARDGFGGASLDAIARDSGYTTGAIYWHFGGKEDLFLAAFEAYTASRARDIAEIWRAVDGGELPPRAWADQWMRRLRDEPDFLVLILEFAVHAWRNPPLRAAFAERMATGRRAVAQVLEEEAARAAFELPMPADALGTVIRELGTGLGLAKLVDPDGVPDSLFGDFIEALVDLAAANRTSTRTKRPRS